MSQWGPKFNGKVFLQRIMHYRPHENFDESDIHMMFGDFTDTGMQQCTSQTYSRPTGEWDKHLRWYSISE